MKRAERREDVQEQQNSFLGCMSQSIWLKEHSPPPQVQKTESRGSCVQQGRMGTESEGLGT